MHSRCRNTNITLCDLNERGCMGLTAHYFWRSFQLVHKHAPCLMRWKHIWLNLRRIRLNCIWPILGKTRGMATHRHMFRVRDLIHTFYQRHHPLASDSHHLWKDPWTQPWPVTHTDWQGALHRTSFLGFCLLFGWTFPSLPPLKFSLFVQIISVRCFLLNLPCFCCCVYFCFWLINCTRPNRSILKSWYVLFSHFFIILNFAIYFVCANVLSFTSGNL